MFWGNDNCTFILLKALYEPLTKLLLLLSVRNCLLEEMGFLSDPIQLLSCAGRLGFKREKPGKSTLTSGTGKDSLVSACCGL